MVKFQSWINPFQTKVDIHSHGLIDRIDSLYKQTNTNTELLSRQEKWHSVSVIILAQNVFDNVISTQAIYSLDSFQFPQNYY